MSDGLKPGAGTDPFGDSEDSEDEPLESDRSDDVDEEDSSSSEPELEIPYVLRRSEVKEGREDTNFALRDRTKDLEDAFQDDVEDAVGTDVYLTDLREAAYCYAMEHPEEVAELLLEWGYEHRR